MATIRRHHFDRPGLRPLIAVVLSAALAIVAGRAGAAAQSVTGVEPTAAEPGWTLTPSLVFSTSHDDNVLLHERADNPPADFVKVVNPRAALDFRGRRSQFSGTYDGALLLYQEFTSLNSYDQRGSLRFSHRLSRHVSLIAANIVSAAPTTELLQTAGVPFARTGSSMDDLSGGVEAALTKRTSIIAVARLQWVGFEETRPVDPLLRGGSSRGGSVALRHRLSACTTLTGDYDLHRATVSNGQAAFGIQNGSVGFEHILSEPFRVFAAGGLSVLGVSTFGPARTGANYRAGIAARIRAASFDVSYNRAFVPSFGFGGTMQNHDLTARVQVTLSRRAYAQSSFSWRRNDPLTLGELSLRSLWTQALAGYALQPWVRIEGFYGSLSQTIARPGGRLGRTRLGFQIVTTKPMRIR